MKRSDPIKLIESMVKNYDDMKGKPRPTFHQFATAILKTMEDLGMAPPKHERFPGSDWTSEIREWESEDA